jgi:hypothetical protein
MSNGLQARLDCNVTGQYLYVISNIAGLGICELQVFEANKNLLGEGNEIDYSDWKISGGSSTILTSSLSSSTILSIFSHGVQGAVMISDYVIEEAARYKFSCEYKSTGYVSSGTAAYDILIPPSTGFQTTEIYFSSARTKAFQLLIERNETMMISKISLEKISYLNQHFVDLTMPNYEAFTLSGLKIKSLPGEPLCEKPSVYALRDAGKFEKVGSLSYDQETATEIFAGKSSRWRITNFGNKSPVCGMQLISLGFIDNYEEKKCQNKCEVLYKSHVHKTSCSVGCTISASGGSTRKENGLKYISSCESIAAVWRENHKSGSGSLQACNSGLQNYGIKKSLKCPSGTYISDIQFASYGSPSGKCGAFRQSQCHAKYSLDVVSSKCVGKVECGVSASNNIFGENPCADVNKVLKVQAACKTLPDVLKGRMPYQMTIGITDIHGATAKNKISVYVKDINEPPVINEGIFTVRENSDKGTQIGSPIVANDQDEGDTLSFHLVGGDEVEKFQINKNSGQISLLGDINFER